MCHEAKVAQLFYPIYVTGKGLIKINIILSFLLIRKLR